MCVMSTSYVQLQNLCGYVFNGCGSVFCVRLKDKLHRQSTYMARFSHVSLSIQSTDSFIDTNWGTPPRISCFSLLPNPSICYCISSLDVPFFGSSWVPEFRAGEVTVLPESQEGPFGGTPHGCHVNKLRTGAKFSV